MQGEALLEQVDSLYAARIRGDKEAVAAFWAPGATYQLIGAPSALPGAEPGMLAARTTVDSLIDLFQFHAMEQIESVAAGNKAAVRWHLTVSTGGRPPVTTELLDFFTFDAEGKVVSLIQAADTALIARMLA